MTTTNSANSLQEFLATTNYDLISSSIRPQENLFTLSMLVANKPGVLVRIALFFSRRGCNIESLNVSHTLDKRFSRMVLTIDGSNSKQIKDITKQGRNLVDVIHITQIHNRSDAEKKTYFVKISTPNNFKPIVLRLIQEFKFSAVDFVLDSITIQITAHCEDYETFLEILKQYGKVEKLIPQEQEGDRYDTKTLL